MGSIASWLFIYPTLFWNKGLLFHQGISSSLHSVVFLKEKGTPWCLYLRRREFGDVMFLTVKSLIIRDDEKDALVLTRALRGNILKLGHAMTRGGCTSVYFSGTVLYLSINFSENFLLSHFDKIILTFHSLHFQNSGVVQLCRDPAAFCLLILIFCLCSGCLSNPKCWYLMSWESNQLSCWCVSTQLSQILLILP